MVMKIYKCQHCKDTGWVETGHYTEEGWYDDGPGFCPMCNMDGDKFEEEPTLLLTRADGEQELLNELQFNILKTSGDLYDLYPEAPEVFDSSLVDSMDKAMKNLKAGKVSDPIDLDSFSPGEGDANVPPPNTKNPNL